MLVCFDQFGTGGIFESHFTFWLSSKHLDFLSTRGYFHDVPTDATLQEIKLCYRTYPETARESFLQDLVQKETISAAASAHLTKTLPRTWRVQNEAAEYVSLVRKNRDKIPRMTL